MLIQSELSRDVQYQVGAEKGDVWTVVGYDWHHRDGGVHEGAPADDCNGEDDIRNGVANNERDMTRPAKMRETDV